MRNCDKKLRRSAWLRLLLIETAVVAIGALALLTLVHAVDERTRALMPFLLSDAVLDGPRSA